ncbi:class I SAM-dependent methyltransferase (plasmid) [Methylocystis sp. MJC1]|uniref:class I SAM-dependent methyltransferase n=1 Tax=Methylocystis sp. MJC1 TaxID=2654282 RepID=UPI0013EAFE0E|nr:class I SAM-dependent methyltransferase [Methylocystis sp. MJC1]KAF2989301.1 Ubiquinone/menaquinone biosynthesis C-methyltransferase UbiE [Methylocystis sp. MJC1]MBU6529331.1 class I SAM-dependent methyltransferase [Methylocystis sp. MJC1]UZX14191.1 class I SAM-dependent methyltransferase [Methylocystis sp. MJC1]
MSELEEAKAKAAAAYNAAADHFDHPVSSFWHRFGQQTVERLGLREGETVLDVCCGSGGSALPAAEAVGPQGKVVAVDLAERLVALGAAKARAKGLGNIEFGAEDMLALGYPDASFDVAVCVFGIFFVPDMVAATKELWRMLRPGGRLAITTWGPDLFEPANSAFWEAIRAERPDLTKGFNPWERISTPAGLRQMLGEAGIEKAEIVAEAGSHPLNAPEDWWLIAMGSGYRGTLAQLNAATLARVREKNLAAILGCKAIATNVVYGVATK